MSRAEEAALEAYLQQNNKVYEVFRDCYIEGYEQAEKVLKEWIEEQLTILDKQTLLHPDDDVFWEQRNAYKQIKDKLNSL